MASSTSAQRAFVALVAALAFGAAGAAAQSSTGDHERSLYERLGGLEPIAIVVNDFMVVFVQDPLVMANPAVRERKTQERLPYLSYQIVTLVCEVTGGPCSYTGENLRDAHAELNVSEREWERMGEIFVQTLNRHNVPQAEQQELLSILGGTRGDIVVSRP